MTNAATALPVDQTMEIIRKKVQVFEEIDIDRISEFVALTPEGQDHQQNGNMPDNSAQNNNDLSLQEDDSALLRTLNMGAGVSSIQQQ